MKRILNNIGAVSKQAIIGGAIGVATLMVGIGLMNNFSSKSGSEQGFASNALERGYSSYDSAYTGTSADDILSARDYTQGSERAGSFSSITGADRLAISKKGSAQNAATADQADMGVEDGAQEYGAGEIEGMGTSNKVVVDVAAEDAAAAKAQREAKIAKGQALGSQARATLKTSKMADGSGIKGMPTGSTSMTYGTLGSKNAASSAAAGKDSSKISLSQGQLSNVNLQAAKAGKLGGMGAGAREADGKKLGRAAIGQNYESLGDLGRASKYSRSGKQAVVSDRALGAADAAAAFDGSKEADAVNLEGENLQQAALNNLKDMGAPDMQLDFDKIKSDIDTIDANTKKLERLMDQYLMCIWSMVLILSVATVGIAVASKFGYPGLIASVVIFAIAAAALLVTAGTSMGFLKEIADLAKETGYTKAPKGIEWAAPWLIAAGSIGALAATVWGGIGTMGKGAAYKFVVGLLTSIGLGGASTAINHMVNHGKNIKATKEAEEAAKKIEKESNNL